MQRKRRCSPLDVALDALVEAAVEALPDAELKAAGRDPKVKAKIVAMYLEAPDAGLDPLDAAALADLAFKAAVTAVDAPEQKALDAAALAALADEGLKPLDAEREEADSQATLPGSAQLYCSCHHAAVSRALL